LKLLRSPVQDRAGQPTGSRLAEDRVMQGRRLLPDPAQEFDPPSQQARIELAPARQVAQQDLSRSGGLRPILAGGLEMARSLPGEEGPEMCEIGAVGRIG